MRTSRYRYGGATSGWAAGLLLLMFLPGSGAAPLPAPGAPETTTCRRVFLDCQRGAPCDRNHFRAEIRTMRVRPGYRCGSPFTNIVNTRLGGGGGGR